MLILQQFGSEDGTYTKEHQTFPQIKRIPAKFDYTYHCNIEAAYTPIADRGSSVVKVLYYKSEGRWFDSRWCNCNFSLT